MSWQVWTNAEKIPAEWDDLAGSNIFLKRAFLRHLERTNPCRQSYNLLLAGGEPGAIYVDYHLKLDVLTFRSLSCRLPVLIMGIPCSVSKQGFAVREGLAAGLLEHFQGKRGAKIILNSGIDLPGRAGVALPTCRLDLKWDNMQAYLESMRSHYRNRLKKARRKFAGVEVRTVSPASLDPAMYRLYEAVYDRSTARLEKQAFDFFQEMPVKSVVIRASREGKMLGFVLLVENGGELILLFTGFDRKSNREYDTYLNLLLEIVNHGLRGGFTVIDFGQTTEETKLKLGSRLEQRRLYVNHSNPLVHGLANRFIDLFSYKPPRHCFRVFK